MNTVVTTGRRFEFSYADRDVLMEVEETDQMVVIRVTRDVFSTERKQAILGWLANEGFISLDYRFCPVDPEQFSFSGVRWGVDYSWLQLTPAILRPARRFMVGLLIGVPLLWVVLVWALLFNSAK